jgi:hypothetical protein
MKYNLLDSFSPCLACKTDQTNWRSRDEPCTVWTMAQDRMLIRTEMFDSTTIQPKTTDQPCVEPAVEAGDQSPDKEELEVVPAIKVDATNSLADEVASEAKELLNGTVATGIASEKSENPQLNCDAAVEVEEVLEVVENFDETAKEAQEIANNELVQEAEEKVPAVENIVDNAETVEDQKNKIDNPEIEDTASEVSETTGKESSATENEENKQVKEVSKKKANITKKDDQLVAETIVFPTLGGFVYFIAPCPFVPGRVAIGVGDDTIRVWNMNDPISVNVTCIWQRIKGKVMSVCQNIFCVFLSIITYITKFFFPIACLASRKGRNSRLCN